MMMNVGRQKVIVERYSESWKNFSQPKGCDFDLVTPNTLIHPTGFASLHLAARLKRQAVGRRCL